MELDERYQKRLKDLRDIQQAFTVQEAQFAAAIEQRKSKDLFERKKEVFRFDVFKNLIDDVILLLQKIKTISIPGFWIDGWQQLWASAGFVAVSFVLFFAGALWVLFRTRTSFSVVENLEFVQRLGEWHKLTANLLTLSIIPGGIILTLFLYSRLNTMFLVAPVLQAAMFLIISFLVMSWIRHALNGVMGGDHRA